MQDILTPNDAEVACKALLLEITDSTEMANALEDALEGERDLKSALKHLGIISYHCHKNVPPPFLAEVARASKVSRQAQVSAERDAQEWRAQATEWEAKYRREKEAYEELLLRTQRQNSKCELLSTLSLPRRRRHTIPPATPCTAIGEEESNGGIDTNRRVPLARADTRTINMSSLASTLGACVLLGQASMRGIPLDDGPARTFAGRDSELDEHATVSLADDGRSGVGATAAAAVSVALAQSWAAVAGGKSSCLPDPNIALQPGKARFKLVAAVPRPMRKETSSNAKKRESLLGSSPGPGSIANGALDNGDAGTLPPSPSHGSLISSDTALALESLDDPRVMDDTQEATWRASGSHLKLQWLSAPTTVLVVFKPTEEVLEATAGAVAWLLRHGISVIVEPPAYEQVKKTTRELLLSAQRELGAGQTLAERQDSTGSTVFGPAPILSDQCHQIAEEEIAQRTALAEGADDIDDLLHQLLRTWDPDTECGCSDVIPSSIASQLDLVLTVGGDGTVLWACALLGHGAVPPIVPLAMGSLGFMTPFPLSRMDAVLARVTSVAHSFPLMLRHRLQCRIVRRGESVADLGDLRAAPCGEDVLVLNEVVIDRGMTASLANLQCFVDRNFVTTIQGDGLIVSTPTGSTAYNLAAGGSMVHPSVPCILFTPICPHTLSSRPLVFPEHVTLRVKVPADSRAEAYCSFDGKGRQVLHPGDSVLIYLAQWPVPMVCNLDSSHDWFLSVREGLHWNRRVAQKPM